MLPSAHVFRKPCEHSDVGTSLCSTVQHRKTWLPLEDLGSVQGLPLVDLRDPGWEVLTDLLLRWA